MKKFIINLIYILSILLLIMVCLEIGYTSIFRNSVPRNKIDKAISLKGKHIDYIFLGSSRVENHIDCDIVEKLTGKTCVNLGVQAGKIYDAIALLETLDEQNTTYTSLLLQVDYSYNIRSYSPLFKSQITPYLDIGENNLFTEMDASFKGYTMIPFYRYMKNDKLCGFRELVTRISNKKTKVDLDNGFVFLEGTGRKLSGHYPEKVRDNPKIKEMLDSYKDRMLFYTAPYCKNAENRDSFIKELGGVVPVLYDYSSIFDREEQNFSNCGHLNREGASLFTERLTNDLLLDH